MVYVDDFKMAGPKKAVEQMWDKFAKLPKDIRIAIGEPTAVDHFLGCQHETITKTVNGRKVRGMRYNMKTFFEQCIKVYEDLAGPNYTCTPVDTPIHRRGCGRPPTSHETLRRRRKA